MRVSLGTAAALIRSSSRDDPPGSSVLARAFAVATVRKRGSRNAHCESALRPAAGPRRKRGRVHRRRTADSDFPTASGARPFAFSHGTRGRANRRSRHVARFSSAQTAGVPAAERSSDSLRGGARINVAARRDSDAPLVSRARGRARPPLSRATGAALDAELPVPGARAALGGGPRRRRTKRKVSRVFTRFFYQHFYLCRNIGKF